MATATIGAAIQLAMNAARSTLDHISCRLRTQFAKRGTAKTALTSKRSTNSQEKAVANWSKN